MSEYIQCLSMSSPGLQPYYPYSTSTNMVHITLHRPFSVMHENKLEADHSHNMQLKAIASRIFTLKLFIFDRWLQRTRFSGGLKLQEKQLAYLVTINELVSRKTLATSTLNTSSTNLLTQISTQYGTVLNELTNSTVTFQVGFKVQPWQL